MKVNSLLYCFVFVFVAFCTKETDKNDVSLHPVQEKMPYANVQANVLEVQDGGKYIDLLPESVQALYRFLNGETHTANQHELALLTTDAIDISAINDSTLLILEKDKNRLIEYDLKGDEYEIIANQGRGPGDILFARELSFYNNRAIVAMQGFQLSVFTCSDGYCIYDNTIATEYNNYSAAPVEDYLYFLGISSFGHEQDPDPANTSQYLIHKINYEGVKKQSYLPVYNFRAPVVREQMNSGGRVRTFPEFGTTVVTFDFHPYIYIYDTTGELTAKYEIPDFIQGFYEYQEEAGRYRGRLIYGSNSRITFTSKLDNRWLLMRIREQRDVEFISLREGFRGDEWHSYYAFDIDVKKLYQIGDDIVKPYAESRVLHVIDQGLIINEEGTLFWADM